MGRKSKITVYEGCPYSITRHGKDKLYKVLMMKTPSRAKTIALRFEAYTGCMFCFSNMNMVNLAIFKDRCFHDLANNTVATICGWLASSIKIVAHDSGVNPDGMCSILNVSREEGSFAWINQDEIDKIVEYYHSSEGVKRSVAALAILEFYTAARKSDTTSFDSSNMQVHKYIDEETSDLRTTCMVSYTSQKTKIKANIPTKPIVAEILSDTTIDTSSVSTSMFNYHIKLIGEEIGLDRKVVEHRGGKDEKEKPLHKCLSSHSFRRSFATVLRNEGATVDTIAQMMGHTNTQQTSRYIQSDTLVLDNKVMNFFK